MIEYKNCAEVSMDLIYSAFVKGFSDYIIKLSIPKKIFIERFFGTEGNTLEQSFIALDDNRPVGIVLGGIKLYEGVKTMRCGTLAVIPEYRGKGISNRLMKLHKEEAVKHKCKQLFLEVIVGNDRAINFYKKLKYEIIYQLNYFSLENFNNLHDYCKLGIYIKPASIEELKLVRKKVKDVHINWQNDIDFIEKCQGQITLGAYINEKLAGIISANKNSRINLIWVENALRHNKIGTNLLIKYADKLGITRISIGVPNNASIHGFLNNLDFNKETISQYEMYYTL